MASRATPSKSKATAARASSSPSAKTVRPSTAEQSRKLSSPQRPDDLPVPPELIIEALGYLTRLGSDLIDLWPHFPEVRLVHKRLKTAHELRTILRSLITMKETRRKVSTMASVGALTNHIVTLAEAVNAEELSRSKRKTKLKEGVERLAHAYRITLTDEEVEGIVSAVGGRGTVLKSGIIEHLSEVLRKSGSTVEKLARAMASKKPLKQPGFVRDQTTGEALDASMEGRLEAARFGVRVLAQIYGRDAVVAALDSVGPIGPKATLHEPR